MMVEHRIIKVLVIEDDAFIAMVYEDLLRDVSNTTFELSVFTDLAQGTEAAKSKTFDVLLLDLNLPDSDLTNTIANIPVFSDRIPVVVMTSTVDDLLALKTMNMGGQDYLNKSKLDRTLFIRSILYAIERHQLRSQLRIEKEKSDNLLRNILPQSIAEELKAEGIVQARQYEKVSVMFIDFADFTAISATMEPQELVQELHTCFSKFDTITENYGLEKIKTIGDAYMCAGGIPKESENHTERMLNAAFEIMQYVEQRYVEKLAEGKTSWRSRIGIHIGPAIAGVVGSKKFTYDIWGDTVNTAARIETNSQPGHVNISEAAYHKLKDLTQFKFLYRGKLEAKGKGLIDMYFVERL